jgi:hypothetical protein
MFRLFAKLILASLFGLILYASSSTQVVSASPTTEPANVSVIVYGFLRFRALSREKGPAPFYADELKLLDQPAQRVRIVLFWSLGGAWNYLDELYSWETPSLQGYYQSPEYYFSQPVQIAVRFELSDSRVQIRNPDNNNYSYFIDEYIGGNLSGVVRYDRTFGSYFENQFEYNLGQAFYLYDLTARDGYNFLQNQVAWNDNRRLAINFPKKCVDVPVETTDCYRWGDIIAQTPGELFIQTPRSASYPDGVLHEYGHFVLAKYISDWSVINACASQLYSHNPLELSSQTCAYSEGWSNFFQAALQSDMDILGWEIENLESSSNIDNVTYWNGEQNELTTAAGCHPTKTWSG